LTNHIQNKTEPKFANSKQKEKRTTRISLQIFQQAD